jgi:cation diffusion facilitator CzcD-associated flavoprotein CzcO
VIHDFAIVGAGFSGLCMAIKLEQAGRSYVVLEKGHAVGGTWRDNSYPGCACDIPSHLYSYSFAPNPRWSRTYAPQAEIFAYLDGCADRYGVRPRIRFDTEVTHAELDEATGIWRLDTCGGGGEPVRARHVVFATGPFSRPATPELRGLAGFRGKTFHSAAWDHGYDLTGKRVGVIGTGASAVQFVPRIAPRTRSLHLYQRTPPWVLPRHDRAVTPREQALFAAAPVTQRLARGWIYAVHELRALGFTVSPRVMTLLARLGRRHIRRAVRDEALAEALTPDYTPGCKRILMADDYYRALAAANVEVVTESIDRISAGGVVTDDGIERELDAIIFATGFRVTDLFAPMRVLGRGGVDLNDAWRSGLEAYLGTSVAGFPNFYMLLGPNTGLGHNSMVFMAEAQVHYVLACVRAIEARGARPADVRPGAQSAFNARLQERLGDTVWASGCKSWYLDERGKNTTLWPGFTLEFWLRTRRVNPAHYEYLGGSARERDGERHRDGRHVGDGVLRDRLVDLQLRAQPGAEGIFGADRRDDVERPGGDVLV